MSPQSRLDGKFLLLSLQGGIIKELKLAKTKKKPWCFFRDATFGCFRDALSFFFNLKFV
jgi:hypothetical protein